MFYGAADKMYIQRLWLISLRSIYTAVDIGAYSRTTALSYNLCLAIESLMKARRTMRSSFGYEKADSK